MGNRAVITTKERKIGLYLHWNGGRDTIEPLLKYCELQGYRPPSQDCYGWARMCQVMGNFFGGSLSIGIDTYSTDRQMDPGDNGVYVIDGWHIANHLRTEYDADWNPIGMRSFEPTEEEDWHKFNEMLHAFDEAMPKGLRLGDFLDAPEIPTSEVRLGDKVWMREYESGYELFEVVGFGADDAPRGLVGAPFVNRYEHEGDYSWNGNNYIDSDTPDRSPRVTSAFAASPARAGSRPSTYDTARKDREHGIQKRSEDSHDPRGLRPDVRARGYAQRRSGGRLPSWALAASRISSRRATDAWSSAGTTSSGTRAFSPT